MAGLGGPQGASVASLPMGSAQVAPGTAGSPQGAAFKHGPSVRRAELAAEGWGVSRAFASRGRQQHESTRQVLHLQ